MSRMIQLRHVPDPLHRKLKARAATRGLSLSDYLVREITRIAECPTIEEIMERIDHQPAVVPDVPPAQAVRELRDSYDRGRRVRSS